MNEKELNDMDPTQYIVVNTPKEEYNGNVPQSNMLDTSIDRISIFSTNDPIQLRNGGMYSSTLEKKVSYHGQIMDNDQEKKNNINDLCTQELVKQTIINGFDKPQITVKSIFVGIVVGIFNSILCLYYGLKTGVIPSLNVLAGLGGFMVMQTILKLPFFNGSKFFTVQENAVIQTCAVATYSLSSAAGFTSGLLALTRNVYEKQPTESNFPNDIIDLNWFHAFTWCCATALFGFFVAFPLRDNMIMKQKLLFPSGTATAMMIGTLHSSKETAEKQWKLLTKSGVISYFWVFFLWFFGGPSGGEGLRTFPIFGLVAQKYTWYLEFGPGVAAIGFMLPLRVMGSIFIGSIIGWILMDPLLTYQVGYWFTSYDYDGLKGYRLFSAISIIVIDAIMSLMMVCYNIYKSFNEEKKKSENSKPKTFNEHEILLEKIFHSTSIPNYTWIGGLLIFGFLSVIIIDLMYKQIKWYQIFLSTLFTPIFAIGIIQGVGISDWNISSAVGKLVMFLFGSWAGGSITVPLVLCMSTIVGCSQAADLMQDFKTGYLVGASPKAMVVAQLFGAVVSCFVAPTVWSFMNSAYEIPGPVIAAPFGEVYRQLAVISINGLGILPKHCILFMFIFALWTIITNSYIEYNKYKKNEMEEENIKNESIKEQKKETNGDNELKLSDFIPIPMAVAIGMIVPAYFSLEGMIVGLFGYFWNKRNKKEFQDSQYILASGMMAGEGLFVLTQIIFSFIGLTSPIDVIYEKVSIR